MGLSRILIRENDEQQVIFLKEKGGERTFPIIIGVFEAVEINRKITDMETVRPMTHDLVRAVYQGLEATLDRVVIDDLREATFYAKLHLTRAGTTVEVDSRPSDAIALAAAEKCPIFVDEKVLEEVGGPKE